MIREIKYKDHDEWLAIRHQFIGGSEASSVIGLNPYRSAYALWSEKTDKVPGFEGNLTTEVGAYLEDLVAHLFEKETGKKVRKKNATLVNDLYPFAEANVDRMVVGEKAFLEIKTTTSVPIMKQLKSSEFPIHYLAQCVHYLAVTGLEKCYLAVLVNCRELKIFELERDQDEIDALMKAEEEFWELVKTDTPPEPDGSDSTSEAIKTFYADSVDEECSLLGYESMLKEYTELSNQIKVLEKLRDEKANHLKIAMGECQSGRTEGFKVLFKTQTRSSFDKDRFKADYPHIPIADYYKTSKSRPFKVTEI